jgi:hypothetical protein
MPINPNIAMGVRPIQLDNPLAQYAQFSQIQNAQKQNELAALQVEAAKRGAEEEVAVKNFFASNPDLASPEARNKLTGFGKTGLAYSKLLSEQETANLTRDQLKQTIYKQKLEFGKQALRDLSLNPSDENIIAYGQDAVIQKLMTPEESAAKTKQLLGMPVPERQAYMAAQGAQSKELMALFESKPVERSDGQSKWLEESNPRLPTFGQVVRAPIQMQATPGEVLRANTPASVAEFNRAQTDPAFMDFLQKRAAATRAPVQPVAPTITTIEDPTKPGSFLQVDARTYQGGGAGSPGVIGGARPSATTEKTAAQRVQMGKDLGFAITQLSDITKDGGLIDQSTGSGAGKLVDIGAGFIGKATPGAIAIGKIAPIADLVLKMVPRFEGPQSNADTKSYKEAAGQLADASLPTAIRKEAGKTVLRIMTERKNQFSTREMAAEGAEAAQVAPPAGFVPDQR